VIPPFAAVEGAYLFLARRHGFQGSVNPIGVRNALALAAQLAEDEASEPAALFYALSRHPKALGGAWRSLPALLATNHASRLGYRLRATRDDFLGLYTPIASNELGFQDVRQWFAARMSR
jgi:hypothetical protein